MLPCCRGGDCLPPLPLPLLLPRPPRLPPDSMVQQYLKSELAIYTRSRRPLICHRGAVIRVSFAAQRRNANSKEQANHAKNQGDKNDSLSKTDLAQRTVSDTFSHPSLSWAGTLRRHMQNGGLCAVGRRIRPGEWAGVDCHLDMRRAPRSAMAARERFRAVVVMVYSPTVRLSIS